MWSFLFFSVLLLLLLLKWSLLCERYVCTSLLCERYVFSLAAVEWLTGQVLVALTEKQLHVIDPLDMVYLRPIELSMFLLFWGIASDYLHPLPPPLHERKKLIV